jgi:hypothetical protein
MPKAADSRLGLDVGFHGWNSEGGLQSNTQIESAQHFCTGHGLLNPSSLLDRFVVGLHGRDSRSRQIKEDPRIGPFLQQWKTREKNRDRSENFPDSQKDSKIDRKTQTQRPL